MTDIIPYTQTLSHGCLVACLLMLHQQKHGIIFSSGDEEQLLMKGMRRTYPFYVIGVPQEFYNAYHKPITLIADNKYFAGVLAQHLKDIKVEQEKITLQLIEKLTAHTPVVCHIDDHYLGDYSHCSHFIVIEKVTDKRCLIVDPWSGKKKWITKDTLESAIKGLKEEVKMCPLVYYLA